MWSYPTSSISLSWCLSACLWVNVKKECPLAKCVLVTLNEESSDWILRNLMRFLHFHHPTIWIISLLLSIPAKYMGLAKTKPSDKQTILGWIIDTQMSWVELQ